MENEDVYIKGKSQNNGLRFDKNGLKIYPLIEKTSAAIIIQISAN